MLASTFDDRAVTDEHSRDVGDRIETSRRAVEGDAKVAGTGGWDRYRTVRVGTVRLPAGQTTVTIRAAGPIKTALMSTRGLKLFPAGG